MPGLALVRVAAGLLWLSTFGLGIPCLLCIRSLRAGRGIATVFGYPAYGQGPFEQHGIPTTVPLVVGFLLICILDGIAGWLLWEGHRSGAIMGTILLVPEAVYWWGFALPFPPIAAVVRTVLIAVEWRHLN